MTVEEIEEVLKQLIKSKLDLQSRIDKAINYINNLDKEDINVYQEDKYWAYILYILKGETNE